MKKATPDQKKEVSTKKKPQESSPIAKNSSLIISIDAAKAEKMYTKVLTRLATKVKLQGFRPGKVPAKLAEEQLGVEYVTEKALQELLPEAYTQAIAAEKKQPISYPEFKAVSIEAGKPWEIEAQFAEAPQFSIKNYQKTVKDVLKTAQKEWDELQKETAKNKAASSTKTNDVSVKDDPESLAQQFRDFKLQKIYIALITEFKPQVPEILVKQEAQHEMDQLVRQLEMFKMKLEDFLARRNVNFEDFSSELAASAVGRLQHLFIQQKVKEEAKLDITDAEVESEINANSSSDFVQKNKDNPEYKQQLKETLLRKKISDHLLSL